MPIREAPTRCRRARPLLGTLVEVEARGLRAAEAAVAGFAAVVRVQRLMSRFEAGSDVGRLNAARVNEQVSIDSSTRAVLTLAAALEAASDGAFHCARAMDGLPHDGPAWSLEGCTVRKHAPLTFDLGGIAKGYAVDCAIDAMLAVGGTTLALVNAGGDMRHAGTSSVEVALRDPSAPAQTARFWTLCNAAIASSVAGGLTPQAGDEPRLHPSKDGSILPPHAGACVLAPSCTLADGLTKVVLLCRDPAHPLLERHAACTLLYADGRLPVASQLP